jgi:hypothetical protein
VYDLQADEGRGLTSFSSAFQCWMNEIKVCDLAYDAEFFGADNTSIQKLRQIIESVPVSMTMVAPSKLQTKEHCLVEVMLLLRKHGFTFDRRGIKQAFLKILTRYPHLKEACVDLAVLRYPWNDNSLFESILMSHQSNAVPKRETKEFQVIYKARQEQPLSPTGCVRLKQWLDESDGASPSKALCYIAACEDYDIDDVVAIIKKHLCGMTGYEKHHNKKIVSEVFDYSIFKEIHISRLKNRLLEATLHDASLKANAKYVLDYVGTAKPVVDEVAVNFYHSPLMLALCMGKRSKALMGTNHWMALKCFLDSNSSQSQLQIFGKFANQSKLAISKSKEGAEMQLRKEMSQSFLK